MFINSFAQHFACVICNKNENNSAHFHKEDDNNLSILHTYIMQYNGSWMHDFDIFEHYIQCRRMNLVPKIVFIFYFKQTMGLDNTCIYCSCSYRITNWLLLVLSLRFIKIFYFTRLKPLSIRWWQNSHWLSACLPAMACGPLNKRFWCHCLLLTFLCDIYCNKMINSDKVCLVRLARLNEREKVS